MFDFVEEALDEVALLIEGVVAGVVRRCCSGRDDRLGLLGLDGLTEGVGIIGLVPQDVAGGKTSDKGSA